MRKTLLFSLILSFFLVFGFISHVSARNNTWCTNWCRDEDNNACETQAHCNSQQGGTLCASAGCNGRFIGTLANGNYNCGCSNTGCTAIGCPSGYSTSCPSGSTCTSFVPCSPNCTNGPNCYKFCSTFPYVHDSDEDKGECIGTGTRIPGCHFIRRNHQNCTTECYYNWECPSPVNCVVSSWSAWSSCSATCGGGTQTRTRTITTQPAHGGTACPVLSENRNCNTHLCPIDCVVSNWSDWSSCTRPCGTGSQTRNRTITTQPAHGGTACPVLSETGNCNTHSCGLNVSKTGDGLGTITSSPAGGINCGTDCSEGYTYNQPVTLTASPYATHSSFLGWSRCDGTINTNETCTVTMNDARSATARFDLRRYNLNVQVNSGNLGRVFTSGTEPVINNSISQTCTRTTTFGTTLCAYNNIVASTLVTLEVDAGKKLEVEDVNDNYYFHNWIGDHCNNSTSETCIFNLTTNRTVTGAFRRRPSISHMNVTNLTEATNNCNEVHPQVELQWNFNDNHSTADRFSLEIRNQNDPNDIIIINNISPSATRVEGTTNTYRYSIGNRLRFNSRYTWQVRSWNTVGARSHWSIGTLILTVPRHPIISFRSLPFSPHVGEEAVIINTSRLNDFSNINPGQFRWRWIFNNANITESNEINPEIIFNREGEARITLRAYGSLSSAWVNPHFNESSNRNIFCEDYININVRPALPHWQEGDPFGFIKDIFAMNFSQRMTQLGLVF